MFLLLERATVNPPWQSDRQCQQLRSTLEGALQELSGEFGNCSPALCVAMQEAVLAPGKRVRGTLMLLTAAALGDAGVIRAAGDAVRRAACAVEMVHAASLVIDDLPAMDNAAIRRGRPTTHRTHGEGRAILVGISLVTEALRVLATAPGVDAEIRVDMVAVLAATMGPRGLSAGQDLDLQDGKTLEGLVREQDLKTASLFIAGFDILSALHRLPAAQAAALRQVGLHLGRSFQRLDDLLDARCDATQLGKPVGQDRSATGPGRGLLAVFPLDAACERYREERSALQQALLVPELDLYGVRSFISDILPERALA